MAHTEALSADTVKAIAKQVGQKLAKVVEVAPLAALAAPQQPMVGETFSVWMLGLDAVSKIDRDINRLAIQTGRWHHQIRYGGQAQAFARSVPTGPKPEDWSVTQLFESKVAGQIDEAIEWVDGNVPGDPLVRLLIVPAYHVTAFWLIEAQQSQVLMVAMPASFSRLAYRTLYSAKEFLEKLGQEQHAQGLPRL